MSINEIFPMRKRRLNKTPAKTPRRSSTNSNEGKIIEQTPKRITSNNSFGECEIVWDNHSPSPTRILVPGKRKKKTVASEESSSDNNEIADLVKKLANKTGQTPQDSSLYNFWFNEQESPPNNQPLNNNDNPDNKKLLQTPARRTRVRKGKKCKNRVTQELEMLASMVENTENKRNADELIKNEDHCSTKIHSEAKSPLTSHRENAMATTTFQNRFTPETSAKKPQISITNTTTHCSPCISDISDIDWGDDDDVMLSQVDMSAICKHEDQVFTQRSDMVPPPEVTNQEKRNGSSDSSFVTESWAFEDDDCDELILTLEQVERNISQSVNKIPESRSHVTNVKEQSSNLFPSREHTQTQPSKLSSNRCTSTEDTTKKNPSKCVYSKEDIEQKRLEAQQRRKQGRPNTRQTTSTYRFKRK